MRFQVRYQLITLETQ